MLAIVSAYGAHKILKATKARATAACYPTGQPLPRWGLAETERTVAVTRLRSLLGDGSKDVEGPQDPIAAWSDQVPSFASPRDAYLVPALAGYEIRWWSPEGVHEVADLFVFPTAGDASRYVRLATLPRCRHFGAVSYPVTVPAAARSLVWDNPLGYLQADVFFSRGNRAYRVSEVPPGPRDQPPSHIDGRRLLRTPEEIACQLGDARCRTHGAPR